LAPASTSSGIAAVPATAEPGKGALAIGPKLASFAVTRCSLKPIIDPDGNALVVDVLGDDGQGGVVEVTRKTTAGGDKAIPTTTDTVSYAPTGRAQVLAQRYQIGSVVRDPRDPTASMPLLTIDGLTIRASGVFGTLAADAGPSDLAYGDLVVTCTQDALAPHTESSSSSSG
jgi:hypothetical protein